MIRPSSVLKGSRITSLSFGTSPERKEPGVALQVLE